MTAYKKYPRYKTSGVEWLGEVPEHWEVGKIGYVVDFNPRPKQTQSLNELSVSFLPMAAIGTNGQLDLTETRQFQDVVGAYTFMADDDICYAKVTPCFENGKGAVLAGLENGMAFGSSELTVLRPKNRKDISLLKYYLISEPFRKLGASWMTGTAGLQRVPDAFAKLFPFLSPPLPEQHAIAEYLDRETAALDALIEKKERLMELLEEKRQALISHAVTKGLNPNAPMKDSGVEWLGEVPAHWEVKKLKYLCEIAPSSDVLRPSKEVSFVPMSHVNTDGTYKNDDVRTVQSIGKGYTPFKEGDLCYAKVTPCFENGKGAVFEGLKNGYGFGSSELTVLRPNKRVVSHWLFSITKSNAFRQLGRSSMSGVAGLQRVANEFAETFPTPIPPLAEQAEIMSVLKNKLQQFNTLNHAITRSIALLKEKRSALITAVVTGQVDVRDEVA